MKKKEIEQYMNRSRNHANHGYIQYAVSHYLKILDIFSEQSIGNESKEEFKCTYHEILSDAEHFAKQGDTRVLEYLESCGLKNRFI